MLPEEFSSSSPGDLEALEEKNQYLSETVNDTYIKLYLFDRSILGRLFFLIEILYSLLTFRPRGVSRYRQLIDEARNYVNNDAYISYTENKTRGRLALVVSVFKYFFSHPYSSLRLISWYRVKKLFLMLFARDSTSASAWVAERFPLSGTITEKPIIFLEDQDFDNLVIDFPSFRSVEISIVVPVFNNYRTTISCLLAIKEHTHGIPYEIIIADDASNDSTKNIEERVSPIVISRQEENVGFLRNCNEAVKKANGKYVVLLNNDTNVQPGWLEPLLKVIKSDFNVGLVGPKLVYPDGTLQEAGGVIWGDGSGWNFGKGANPTDSEYNYIRDVHYISGACILFPKDLWTMIGGFDERYAPAYYEDTDFAFAVKHTGRRVVYQPASTVVHIEGVSNGTNINAGIKKFQDRNRRKFRAKWKATLNTLHSHSLNTINTRDNGVYRSTVLIIDHYVPFYDKDAGSRSTYLYICRMIKLGIRVKFIGANFFPHQPYTANLQQMGVEVIYGESKARNWKRWLAENASEIDFIYLHRPHITEIFIDQILKIKNRPKIIYFGHDLHFLRIEREALLDKSSESLKSESKSWLKRELAIFEKVDRVFYPSAIEVAKVRELNSECDVDVLPLYCINTSQISQYSNSHRSGILFVGGFGHPPNVDAVLWFIEKIFPSILRIDPDICFHVVGSAVPDVLKKLQSENIIVHGYMSDNDLGDLYKKVRLCVVPLRYGAGVKGKILEALKNGIPIVTTSIGAEGIPHAGEVMAIENDETAYADSVVSIYHSEYLSKNYVDKYADYIEENFSEKIIDGIIAKNFIVDR